MRRTALLLSAASLVALATPPMFHDFVYIFAGGEAIRVDGGHADPCVVDWDGDGVKDLLVGEFTQGRIRYYRNTGTNQSREFADFFYLASDGTIIALPYG